MVNQTIDLVLTRGLVVRHILHTLNKSLPCFHLRLQVTQKNVHPNLQLVALTLLRTIALMLLAQIVWRRKLQTNYLKKHEAVPRRARV